MESSPGTQPQGRQPKLRLASPDGYLATGFQRCFSQANASLKVVTQNAELPRTQRSSCCFLGCSPAAFPSWGRGQAPLPGVNKKLTTNKSASQCFSLLHAPCWAWGSVHRRCTSITWGVQQPLLVLGSTGETQCLLLTAKPLRSQHSPAASVLIWPSTYQIHLQLYWGGAWPLWSSEQPEEAFGGSVHRKPGLSEAKATMGFLLYLRDSSYSTQVPVLPAMSSPWPKAAA